MSHRWCYWWVVYGATDESSMMLLTLTSNTQCRCYRTRVRSWIRRWGMLWIGECSTLHPSSSLPPPPPSLPRHLKNYFQSSCTAIFERFGYLAANRGAFNIYHSSQFILSFHADVRGFLLTTVQLLLPWRPYNCYHDDHTMVVPINTIIDLELNTHVTLTASLWLITTGRDGFGWRCGCQGWALRWRTI